MRIISGYARGMKLKPPRGSEVRPTTDRVKETMFAILGDITEHRILDLFAGSGALGLEALSRGAREVVFVEKNRQSLQTLEYNLAKVRHCFPQDHDGTTKIIRADVRKLPGILGEETEEFDIILADPPYSENKPSSAPSQLLTDAPFRQWAGNNVLLVLEHPSRLSIPQVATANWQIIRQRRFDRTTVTFARPA